MTFQQVQKDEGGVDRVGASRLQQVADALKVKVSLFFEDRLKPGRETETGRVSQDFVSDFLITTEGLALSRAFTTIRDPRTQRGVVRRFEDIARETK